jgi:hypothetical protein
MVTSIYNYYLYTLISVNELKNSQHILAAIYEAMKT